MPSHLSRKVFLTTLYSCIAILLIANLFVVYSETILDRHYAFAWRFYFDRRLNFPFFFSLFLSVTNLVLVFIIVRSQWHIRSASVFWLTLFIAFFLFTLDETFYIHQHFKMSTFGRIASYDRSSWSHYLWVIPYFIVFGALVVVMAKHAYAIAKQRRTKLVIAAIVFLSGAVGMEAVGTYYAVLHPKGDIYLLLIKSAEGVLQMSGAVMFAGCFLAVLADGKYVER